MKNIITDIKNKTNELTNILNIVKQRINELKDGSEIL